MQCMQYTVCLHCIVCKKCKQYSVCMHCTVY